jgi:uncharacterized protein
MESGKNSLIKKRYMKKIELEIVGLSNSLSQTNNYAVVLGEISGTRRLPVVIGSFEANAIAVALERMVHPRPLTHDLFKTAMDEFDIELTEVIISNLVDGIFHAQLVCTSNGKNHLIDARTSDAIALALRFECPIYTYEFILETAGILVDDRDEEPTPQAEVSPALVIQKLEKQLEEAIREENYEKAARLRDEIKRHMEQG